MLQKIKKLTKEIGVLSIGFTLALVITIGLSISHAWTEPPAEAPGGNLGAPINTGSIQQDKAGSLRVTGFRNFSATVLDGNVGIGTTAPVAKLSVVGGGIALDGDSNGDWAGIGEVNGGLMLSAVANAVDVKHLFVAPNGTVGIGTNNPTAKLTVVDENNAGFRFEQHNDADGVNIRSYATRGTINSPTKITASSRIFALTSFGRNDVGGDRAGAQISFIASQDFTTAGNGTDMVFATNNWNSLSITEKMRIKDNGNVGIGTAAPGQKLDVVGYVKGRSGLCIGDDCRESWPSTVATTSFGGMYDTAASPRGAVNPFTGGYSCPAGYSNARVSSFDDRGEVWHDIHYCWK